MCGPDYSNDEKILNDWIENKTEANITKWIASTKNYAVSALSGNKLVGFGLSNVAGEILLLYVLPEFIRKAIGKSIYCNIEQVLLQKGVRKIIAYRTITAKPFYLKMGFKLFDPAIKVGQFDGEFPLEKIVKI